MNELETEPKPILWLIDSERTPLASCQAALTPWAQVRYFGETGLPENTHWDDPPDVVFFSAEIPGGAGGSQFASLLARAENIPLVAVARLRSLAQAVGYFRAGAIDYLALPLDEDDARERAEAAIDKAASIAMQGVMVELEPVDGDPGEISLSIAPSGGQPAPEDDDILAHIASGPVADTSARTKPGSPAQESDADDEPVAVDGLPIPSLWEELPCGLLVFDSNANLAFANKLALELFGSDSLAQLEDALENKREGFKAHSLNQKPFPDNQWPHVVAAKTRTARAALISIEKPDRRRTWLRIDCLPHLHEGKISRLLLTAINLTGELPPLAVSEGDDAPSAQSGGTPRKKPRGGKKGKK